VRVLRLDLSEGTLDLHPFVTVVRGCSPAEREELLAALADVPRGVARVTGLIESHGVLLDLDDDNLALLELATDLDIVVSPQDLPNADSLDATSVAAAERALGEARAQLSAAEAHLVAALASRDEAWDALEAVEREVEEMTAPEAADADDAEPGDEGGTPPPRPIGRDDRGAIEAAVARASVVQVRARHALEEAETALEAARAEQRTVAERLVDAQQALDGSAIRRDPAAEAAAEAARQRLLEAERVLDAVQRGEAPVDVASGDIEELRRERARLEAAVLAIDTPDPLPVRLALEGVGPQRSEQVESPAALELAERLAIADHDHDVASAAVAAADDGRSAVVIRQRIRDAEAAVARTEQQLRGPSNNPEDVKELERAHDEIADAREAAEKRFGAAKAGQRLEEAQAAEAAVLARMGFDSWADYRLGIPSAPPQDTEALRQRLAEAQLELSQALAADQAADADIASELRLAEVVARRRALRAEAVELLGHDPGDDLEGALRRHRVPAADTGTHLDRLRGALAGVGVELGDENLDEHVLRSLAEVWLLEQTAAVGQRGELEQALADVEAKLAVLEGGAASAAPDPLAAAEAAAASARSALEAAEARLASDSEVGAELADARTVLGDLHAREREVADRVALCDEQVQVAAAMLRAADEEVLRGEVQLAELARAAETSASVAAARAVRQARVMEAAGDVEALGFAVDEAIDAAEVARKVYVEAGIAVGYATAHLRHVSETVDATRRRREDDAAGASAEESQAAAAAAAEDIEWFLLARLAAQRSASYAGSVPLVLDEALAGMELASARSILGRLERMATTVQVVILSEELATSSWAESLGVERALVVQR
jgi:hypothetical protein